MSCRRQPLWRCYEADLATSLSGCRAGVHVDVMSDETHGRDVETLHGPGPVALDAGPFLAVIPMVRVQTVESVDPLDVLRDRAEVGTMSSNYAVRKSTVRCCRGNDGIERTAVDCMRKVDRPFVACWRG